MLIPITSPTSSQDQIRRSLHERARADSCAWLDRTIAQARIAPPAELPAFYTSIGRTFGKSALGAANPGAGALVDLRAWSLTDGARALLLLERAAAKPGDFADAATACFDAGDAIEQQSWLRAVGLYPSPDQFLPHVIDGCRTNIVPLFEAIACENPYPARYFPERNFNQLVLKVLFNNIALARIVGLDNRLNADLSRMADDYVSEREAAGRTVPADIWVVLAPFASQAGVARVTRYLAHDDPAHRRWARHGLDRRPSETRR